MVKNIIINFTGLVGLIHVQAGYEAGCFDRDLDRGRWGQTFLSKNFFL